jgi:hypothetical protein
VARKLKVFRTAAGFNDAYVAAPSRKAALAAWGASADLFARGAAEEVTDAALTAEPLARPGEVIMKSRGGLAEQLKALGPGKKAKHTSKVGSRSAPPSPAPKKRAKAPSRAALDKAEAAIEAAISRHAADLARLEAERDDVERRIESLRARQVKEAAKLETRERAARDAYRDALARWSDA